MGKQSHQPVMIHPLFCGMFQPQTIDPLATGAPLRHHSGSIRTVAISPDGQTLGFWWRR
jgi:hypothetical protein